MNLLSNPPAQPLVSPLKGSLRSDDILHCRALKNFEGSIAARDERLNKDILRTMDLTSGDREEDSDAH